METNNILSSKKGEVLFDSKEELIVEEAKKNILSHYSDDKEKIERVRKKYFFLAGEYDGVSIFGMSDRENTPVKIYKTFQGDVFLNVKNIKDSESEGLDYNEALELLGITELQNGDFFIEEEKRVIPKEDREYFEIIMEIEKLNAISMIENLINLPKYNVPFTDEELDIISNMVNQDGKITEARKKQFNESKRQLYMDVLKYLESKGRYYKPRFEERPRIVIAMMRGWKDEIRRNYEKGDNISLGVNKYKVMTFSKLAIDADRGYIPDDKVLKEILQKINNYYVELSKKKFVKYGYIVDMKDIDEARQRGWIREEVYNQVKKNIETRATTKQNLQHLKEDFKR